MNKIHLLAVTFFATLGLSATPVVRIVDTSAVITANADETIGKNGFSGNQGGENTSWNKASDTPERNSKGRIATTSGSYTTISNINTGAYRSEDSPSVASAIKVTPQDVVLITEIPETVRILSLNNSLIAYNDQYKMFNDIAAHMGKKASWITHTLLGQSLLTHYNESGASSAKAVVGSEAWTHIILQEQSSTPRTDIDEFRESVRKWKEYIRANCPNPNAEIIIPMNWAYSEWNTFKADSKTLYDNYMAVAQELGVTVCPVGLAYESVFDKEGSEGCKLLYTDNRHPTSKATYLAACMEYALIYNEPAGSIDYRPEAVSEEDAMSMREYAESTMSTFINPVDHNAGKIHFSAKVVDQSGSFTEDAIAATWTVSGGGTIDENGIFTSDGTAGEFAITATYGNYTGSTTLTVGKDETIKEDEPAIVLDDNVKSISENFDGIGTEATATLPEGWRIDKQLGAPRTVGIFSAAKEQTEQTGANNIASNARNGIWNFGAGGNNESSDRAIGGISTGINNGTRCINVYLHVRNNGVEDIRGLAVKYDIEKYRKGSNSAGFATQLYYSSDGVLWTTAGNDFYTFFQKDNATGGYDETPGESVNVNKDLDVTVESGKDLYLAWNLSVASGTDAQAAQALALDNVEITALNSTAAVEDVANSAGTGVIITGGCLRVLGDNADYIKVYDLDGTQVATADNTNEINLSTLSRGVYIVKIMTTAREQAFKVCM